METEIRKTIRLSIEDYKNIEQIRLEHGLADFSKAICYAVQNYLPQQNYGSPPEKRNTGII